MQKIRFYERKEIDRAKWDSCIVKSGVGLIYGLSWYLDIVSPCWAGLVEGDYNSVMPLPFKKRFGIKYVFQPVFAQQLGVYSCESTTKNVIEAFLSSIPRSFMYIDVNLNLTNITEGLNVNVTKRVNYELNLSENYSTIKSRFTANCLRNIKKGLRLVDLIQNVQVDELIRLKRENAIVKRRKGYYDWMTSFAERMISLEHGKIIGAKIGNKLCAAALFGFYGNRIYYLIPVSNDEGKANRAMFVILEHYIRTFSGSNLILDFEGSNIPGIAQFFGGFGSCPKEYHNVRINRLPFFIRFLKK